MTFLELIEDYVEQCFRYIGSDEFASMRTYLDAMNVKEEMLKIIGSDDFNLSEIDYLIRNMYTTPLCQWKIKIREVASSPQRKIDVFSVGSKYYKITSKLVCFYNAETDTRMVDLLKFRVIHQIEQRPENYMDLKSHILGYDVYKSFGEGDKLIQYRNSLLQTLSKDYNRNDIMETLIVINEYINGNRIFPIISETDLSKSQDISIDGEKYYLIPFHYIWTKRLLCNQSQFAKIKLGVL